MRTGPLIRRGLHSNCSFQHSISRIKWVFSKELNNIAGSNIWWRGRSCAASVASEVPEPQKGRKRVPKEARRALIESFVDKHKAMNAGKFPSVSHTKKQVGGSYYVVRSILQELQNKSTTLPLKSGGEMLIQEKAINCNGSLTEDEKFSKEIPNAGGNEAASDQQMPSCTKTNLSADDLPLPSLVRHSIVPMGKNLLGKDSEEVSLTTHEELDNDGKEDVDGSDFVHTECQTLKNESEVVSDVCLESKSSSEQLEYEDPNHKEEQVHSSLEVKREKTNNRTGNDVELPSKPKPWRHIKSIVDGIIDMWRNR